MRMPSDMPRPRPRRPGRSRQPGRGRVVLVIAAVALLVLITSLRGIAGFYTDYLWFDSLDQSGVFSGILRARLTLFAVFTIGFAVILWVNLFVVDRTAPRFAIAGVEDEVVARYRQLVGTRTGLVRIGVAALFGLIAGAPTTSQWRQWILFNNAVDFGGERDPLFNRDIGFYVFELPFLSFVVSWLFAALVIVLLVTLVAHYLNGGIRVQAPAPQRVTTQVKVHASVLLGLLAIVKAGDYWLQRFELTTSTRGTVDGATYTDVNAQLPALNLLALIALAAAVLFLLNIRRKGWVLPVLGIGIWAVVAVVGGAIVPAIVQRVRVEPSESSREREYIVDNIAATRTAMNLDGVADQPFEADFGLTEADLAGANQAILDNIRLWDPAPDAALATYRSLQSLRPFYAIRDVDVDRYVLDGEVRQVILSTRELNSDGVTQDSWEARHLTFTHGYGFVVSPTNQKDTDGRPSFLVSGIPIDEDAPEEFDVEQPGLYFGEGLGSYVITGTNRTEVDFQDPDGAQQTTTYAGEDGVEIGSFLRRAAFALRYGDLNPLFSGNLRSDSRIHFVRDVRERVSQLAPFLQFDRDPYPVVVDGRISWVIDAYTTTDRFPYGQRAVTDGLDGTDLDRRFNYIRNSVKAVVDAYDGTVTFYIVDDEDPIIRAYADAFPDLFTTDDPPAELASHFRYPEDMFRVQSNMWGRYHLDDPDAFYTQNDAWVVARDPGRARQTSAPADTGSTTTTNAQAPPRQRDRIDPYYVLTRLPGQEGLGFQLLRPFVPFDREDARQQLTAYLVAESDGDRLGELTSYRVTGDLPDGPGIVADSINGDVDVSREQSLLCRAGSGSTCTFGNLIVVPIERSLLYVQPLYVAADRANAPALLQRVIVEYDGEVSIGNTLTEALRGLPAFGGLAEDDDEPVPPDDGAGVEEQTVGELLTEADQLFQQAEDVLRETGDLGEYQRLIEEARDVIGQIEDTLAGEGGDGSDGGSGTTTSTTTTTPDETTSTTDADSA